MSLGVQPARTTWEGRLHSANGEANGREVAPPAAPGYDAGAMAPPRFDRPTYHCTRCGSVVGVFTPLRVEHLKPLGWEAYRAMSYVNWCGHGRAPIPLRGQMAPFGSCRCWGRPRRCGGCLRRGAGLRAPAPPLGPVGIRCRASDARRLPAVDPVSLRRPARAAGDLGRRRSRCIALGAPRIRQLTGDPLFRHGASTETAVFCPIYVTVRGQVSVPPGHVNDEAGGSVSTSRSLEEAAPRQRLAAPHGRD